MITVRKLASLPDGTRERKTRRVVETLVREPAAATDRYCTDLVRFIAADDAFAGPVRERAVGCLNAVETLMHGPAARDADRATVRRALNGLLMALDAALGEEPADWDMTLGQGARGGAGASGKGIAGALSGVDLYVEQLRSPFNLGSIARTAAAFGVARLLLSPGTRAHGSRRFLRSAMGAQELVVVEPDVPPTDITRLPLIALETGGVPITEFRFPTGGTLLVGSEELGLSAGLLAAADAHLSVPMHGAKGSLNVGVAVGIALSWWSAAAASSADPHA